VIGTPDRLAIAKKGHDVVRSSGGQPRLVNGNRRRYSRLGQ
jgi:hypothetical protein